MKTSTAKKFSLVSVPAIEAIKPKEYQDILKSFGLKTVFNGGNVKLQKSNTVGFPLPKYESTTGLIVCPNAGDCRKFCYAGKGNMAFKTVKANFEKRLQLTLSPDFVKVAHFELQKNYYPIVRLHDSGDFYSVQYVKDIVTIAVNNPDTVFYAYTKSHRLIDLFELPNNLIIIKSEGGKHDVINKENERHASIFDNVSDLENNGYSQAYLIDSLAWNSDNKKVGLLINFKGNLPKYAQQYADYHGLNYADVHNEWVMLSGSKRKLI